MNMKPIVAVAIALTVGIVTFSGVLIPAIESGVDTETTFTNEGYFRMNVVTDGNFTFEWDYDDPTKIIVNDETIEYTNNNGIEISVVCSEAFYLRIRDNNASFIYNGPGGNVTADSTGESLSVTIVDNSGTVTNGTDTKTVTNVGDMYHISNSGNYSMKKSNEPAYMNSDSQIFIRGVSRIGTHYVSFVVSGSVDDGPTILGSDVTIENATMNVAEIGSYIDLYQFDSITFDATYTGESTATHVTYNYVIVPYEVTAEKSIHADASTILLFQTIPTIVVLGMIVAVGTIVFFKYRR